MALQKEKLPILFYFYFFPESFGIAGADHFAARKLRLRGALNLVDCSTLISSCQHSDQTDKWRGSGFPISHQMWTISSVSVTLWDSSPLTNLEVSSPIFLYLFPPTLQRLLFEVCFNPSPLNWQTSQFFPTWNRPPCLNGGGKVFAFSLCQEPGTVLFASFTQEPFKVNSFANKESAIQKGETNPPRSHSL